MENNTYLEVNEENIVVAAKEFLEKNYSYNYNNEHGYFEFEVYLDYHDYIEKDQFLNLVGETVEQTRTNIHEHLNECYLDAEWDLEAQVSEEIESHLQNVFDGDELENFDIRDIMRDNEVFFVSVDHEEIMSKSEVDVTIFYERYEAFNHEFGFNCFYDGLEDWLENIEKELADGYLAETDISLFNLIKSQGYTLEQFKHAVYEGTNDTFLSSVIEECENTTSGCNSYVFLKTMPFNEYLELMEQDSITIDKRTNNGFVDFVQGAGGLIDVQLNNDIILDKGEYKLYLDGQYGYGVSEIYGQFFGE